MLAGKAQRHFGIDFRVANLEVMREGISVIAAADGVVAGTLNLWIGDTCYTLNKGDSFSFKSSLPHRYSNPGEDEAEVVSWMSFAASTMHGARVGGAEAFAEAFEITNTKLGDRQWAIGRFTIADIHLFRVYWRFRPTLDAPLGTYPALESHHDRMLARPAVQKAMEIEKGYG